MTRPGPAQPAGANDGAGAVVDGVDVDAVAAAVRSCADVDDLEGGHPGAIGTYLPGRRVAGVRIDIDAVTVGVRARWGVPVFDVAVQVRGALAPLVGDRRIDVVITDLTDPPEVPGGYRPRDGTATQAGVPVDSAG